MADREYPEFEHVGIEDKPGVMRTVSLRVKLSFLAK
jgi:hypothetical protein